MISALLLLALAADPSPVVYPEQSIPLSFDHAQHLEDGADCLTCHDAARKSARAEDRNLPRHPECEPCHDLQAVACQTCHPGFDQTARAAPAAAVFPSPNLRFNHQVHVARKVDCAVCHASVPKAALAGRAELPEMATCLRCHDGRQASADCATCHPSLPGGRLRLTFASGVLRPAAGNPLGLDHGPRYDRTHGARAAQDRATCLACHAQRECEQCHDGTQKPLAIHPGDWITTHPAAVRGNLVQCESCHRLQSFCAACHERAGIGMDADPSLLARNVLVHRNPDSFTGASHVDAGHHGIQASRDLRQCMSCHREESCLRCHSGDALATRLSTVSPHPSGFRRECRALASRNDRPCLRCHAEGALSGWGCR